MSTTMGHSMDHELQGEINKRITLNLLIQGSASHAMFTAHHMVRDELQAVHGKLFAAYDRLSVSLLLNMWIGDGLLFVGHPDAFWRKVGKPTHPFHAHPVLARHGRLLARSLRDVVYERARKRNLPTIPVIHTLCETGRFFNIARWEQRHYPILESIACHAAATIWGISEDRLSGTITTNPRFGTIRNPETRMGRFMALVAIGWGGLEWREDQLIVIGKANCWPLLVHELVKGTAELIALHGLNHLSDDECETVLKNADHIEHEIWHMQVGVEIWSRLLPLLPRDVKISEKFMLMARLDPPELEELVLAIIEQPEIARQKLAVL